MIFSLGWTDTYRTLPKEWMRKKGSQACCHCVTQCMSGRRGDPVMQPAAASAGVTGSVGLNF